MRSRLAGLLFLLLAACAGHPASDSTPLGPPLERFSADGRISLRQGERSEHMAFAWRHSRDQDRVLFSTPLGQGVAELVRDADGAALHVPGQAQRWAADVRALAVQVFGTPLPLDVLAEWLSGARPELAGRIDGWDLVVTESAPYRQRRLPQRLELRHGDVEVRIVVLERDGDE